MATITLTLNATQARVIRRYLLFWRYPAVARDFAVEVENLELEDEREIAEILKARDKLTSLEQLVDQIGWEPITAQKIELTGEEEALLEYVTGAFHEAREKLGGGRSSPQPAACVIEEDARLLAEAQALLPLLEQLDPAEVAS